MRELTAEDAAEISGIVWSIVHRRFASVPSHVADPDDLYQYGMEGAAKAARRFDRKGGASFTTWTTTAAHRAILDGLRSLQPGSRSGKALAFSSLDQMAGGTGETWLELIEDESVDLDAGFTRRTLATAIGELPSRQREALLLRYGHDLTHAQIGERMGTTTGSASASLSIALRKLRQHPALVGLG